MSESGEFTPEERLALEQISDEFWSGFSESPQQDLEAFAFCWWEATALTLTGRNALEAALAQVENFASTVIAVFVDELPESCSAAEARTWARSREAFDEVLSMIRQEDHDQTESLTLLLRAIAALFYSALCRREIEADSADTAVVAMHRATQICHSISEHLSGPAVEEFERVRARLRRGREVTRESKSRRNAEWLGELRRLKWRGDKRSDSTILEEIAKSAKLDRTTVLRGVKKAMKKEGADS